jgi:peptidoglycan/LPS O-acetylase OafA/YrhL
MVQPAPVYQPAAVTPAASARPARPEIGYLYGIRGISALYIMMFHLNYMMLGAYHGVPDPWYHRLTDWMRYGDFRVSAFFVISGYLLMMPATRDAAWTLPAGIRGFLARRAQRLLAPYYVALGISLVLFLIWTRLVNMPQSPKALTFGTLAHVFMVHNLDRRTFLYINDTLWNVALEFQCYVLFAFVLLWLLRRFGPWAQVGAVLVLGLAPHFLFHGFLDCTRPWFIVLYALGVAVCALDNRAHPHLQAFERRIPWGLLFLIAVPVTIVAIAASGMDTSYGDGWLQNLLLGVGVAALLVYTRRGFPGRPASVVRPVVRFLEHPRLTFFGRFSYSIYLIHFPILRLLIAVAAALSAPVWLAAALGALVFAPATVALAYLFHLKVERPFLERGKRARTTQVASMARVPVTAERNLSAPV